MESNRILFLDINTGCVCVCVYTCNTDFPLKCSQLFLLT